MLYVQIPSGFRAQWGLRSNPDLMGERIDVTGQLTAYFSHPGMTGTSAFALDGESPWDDDTYYAPAIGKSGTALRTALHGIIDARTPGTDSDSFEPRDAVKGDDGFPNLELNNSINGTVPWHGKITILLQWNAADPVSTFEMRRNDRIHSTWQGNRSPFIDHPEWAESIW